MSQEVETRMSSLRARRSALDHAWSGRARIYEHHLDALMFLRDADALDQWITSRVPLVRDGKYGENLAQTEELINRHRDLEETIDAQKEKFHALKRITLIERAFKEQKDEEEAARKQHLEQQETERMQLVRKREMERIAEERRRETEAQRGAVVQVERQLSGSGLGSSLGGSVEEGLSTAPQFERLPKPDVHVKRAESMSVVKTPKRTPSFTTRRRTQSFRRHRNPDELPPVEIEGYLERKQESGGGGVRAAVRSWRSYYAVLCGQLLCFFKDQADFASSKAAAPPVAILHARCSPAGDYTKRAHVFRLSCADGAEYLFSCGSLALLEEWVAKLAFHAALPPQLQLTPYGAESPTADVRRRLRNASSSSSEASSPPPRPRPRTQAEILQEHRISQKEGHTTERTSTPERQIQSSVLPSLPPRQPPAVEEHADVTLRNSERGESHSWGRSRFSNGRDVTADFIKSQREAYGSSSRPASVSGGSPALDPRPASRSSGESELSVGGKEKKDKKGVFGGLFSRKKRPQSHM